MKPTVLIICYSDHSREPRLLKEVNGLKDHYRVVTAGYAPSGISGVEFIKLSNTNLKYQNAGPDFHHNYPVILRKAVSLGLRIKDALLGRRKKLYENYSLSDAEILARENAAVIIAHHLESLPLAFSLKKGSTRVVFSAHEYYPLEFETPEFFRDTKPRYDHLCQKYLRQCALIFNSCISFANKYEENFGVKSVIFENTPPVAEIEPLHNASGPLKLVHHGIAIPERKLEQFIDMMKLAGENVKLDLILVKRNEKYFEELAAKIKATPNIELVEPVPYNQIARFLNTYDVGICYLPNNSFNNINSLPNKLFDYIQARIAVLTAPSPEVKAIVEQFGIGWVSDGYTPESMAKTIREINRESLPQKKKNAHGIASRYSAENTHSTILTAIKTLA